MGFIDGALWKSARRAKGGCCRLTLTDLDRQGRGCGHQLGARRGMSVTVDKIGNVFMRREGRKPAAAADCLRKPY